MIAETGFGCSRNREITNTAQGSAEYINSQIGNRKAEIDGIVYNLVVQSPAIESGNRDGNILNVLRFFLRGNNNDIVRSAVCLLILLCEGVTAHTGKRDGGY